MNRNENTERKTVGGFWVKESKGGKFFSGTVTLEELARGEKDDHGRVRVCIWKNDKKDGANPKAPEYRMTADVPLKPAPKGREPGEDDGDDIPF